MKSKFKNIDKPLFFLMLIYTILGLVMVFSASSMTAVLQIGKSESYFFVRQLFFVVIAYIVGFFIIFMSYKFIRPLKKIPNIIAYAAIGLLIITLLFGENINGVTSWLKIFGPIQIQPSEFVKTMTILFIAFSFSNPKKIFKNYKFLRYFVYAMICFFLIAKQPDLGTAMILAMTCFCMFLAIPLKDNNFKKIKVVCSVVAIIGVCLFVFGGDILKNVSFLSKEQLSRLTYNNPCTRYSEKTGYQVCNGYIAINNGGLFGVGLGNSTQKYLYLPEAYTDFIFPVVVEELGAIVGVLIIIGYLIILYRLLRIAKSADTLTGAMISYGTFALIVSHLLINFLGILAIIPLTGVPVPFLSNGGSFAFNLIILLFMCEKVNILTNERKLKRELDRL